MKKQLTEARFQEVVQHLDIGQQTISIAHGVLVEGRTQAEFVKALGLSKGAVSQAVSRVWMAHQAGALPAGYEKVSAVLPAAKAYIVKKWEEDAKKKRGQ